MESCSSYLFCDLLISLTTISSAFIHAVAYGRVSFLFFFSLEDDCFTMLCWFLLYHRANLPQADPLLLQPLSLHGHHGALVWTPCVTEQLPLSSLFHTREHMYISSTLSVHLTLCFPRCVLKAVLCTCVTSSALQISSSVLFF